MPTATPTPTASPTPLPTAEPTPEPTSAAAEPATTSTAVLDKTTRRKLDTILANQVKNKGVAGLQAAVRLPDGEMWLGTAGQAEFLPDRPITEDTQFSIASVTKTFVAALILQLVDEGGRWHECLLG